MVHSIVSVERRILRRNPLDLIVGDLSAQQDLVAVAELLVHNKPEHLLQDAVGTLRLTVCLRLLC